MQFLLDTHTFLWFILDSPKLSTSAKTIIETASNNRLLSVASIWEMAIKSSIGKFIFNQLFGRFIPYQLRINDIKLLEI
jgi:PIN domain nuclease of toxin-antitoxin system